MKMKSLCIRLIEPSEVMLLTDFLYEAIFQPEGSAALSRTVIQEPMVWAYVKDFGQRPDDVCFVAVIGGFVVGAAWSRMGCSYGKVDEKTPEIALSVYPEYRGKGIGTALLSALLSHLREKSYEKVSLSVDKSNFASKMYLKAGFEVFEERQQELIMVRQLR